MVHHMGMVGVSGMEGCCQTGQLVIPPSIWEVETVNAWFFKVLLYSFGAFQKLGFRICFFFLLAISFTFLLSYSYNNSLCMKMKMTTSWLDFNLND